MNLAVKYAEIFDTAFNQPVVEMPKVARGDLLLDESDVTETIPSPLESVTAEQWTMFVRRMISAPCDSVTASNALGLFEIKPRRLKDLGILDNLQRAKSKSGRTIWVGTFMPPLTCGKFLKSAQAQYKVFAKSMKDYAARITSGEIQKPAEMSLSGALAILHRCGPSGLRTWETGERFPTTEMIFKRAEGVF